MRLVVERDMVLLAFTIKILFFSILLTRYPPVASCLVTHQMLISISGYTLIIVRYSLIRRLSVVGVVVVVSLYPCAIVGAVALAGNGRKLFLFGLEKQIGIRACCVKDEMA